MSSKLEQSAVRVETRAESSVLHSVEVEVEASRVGRAYDRAMRDLARQVKVRGFRPGKAPRSVLEKLYGASLAEQVQHTLVMETLPVALEEAGLEAVTEPAIDARAPEAGSPFQYTARVEVKPELSLPDLAGLPGRRPAVVVADEEVESEIEALRQRNAPVMEEPEGTAAATGHILGIDFVGRVDGEPFEGGSGRGVELELGSERFIPGFEEQLIGARPGEDREVRVRFPEDYGNSELAGREAVFAVHVAEIKRRRLPDLDDEFAKDLGPFETLAELRQRIRTDLTAMRERSAREVLHRSLFDALIERTSFEVPPGLVERQLERQIHSARHRLEGQLPEDALDAQTSRWREEWRPRAEREAREMLLLEAVARAEGVSVEAAEVEGKIREMAEQQGVGVPELRKAHGAEALERAMRAQLRDEKALAVLAAQAKIEETSDT